VAAKLGPLAVWSLVRELRIAAEDERFVAVAGARALAESLRRELARGGDARYVREGPVEDAAVLVYVAAGELDDELLRRAHRANVPVVAIAEDDVPQVLATDVVRLLPGHGFPVEEIGGAIARKLGERATALAAHLPVLRREVCAELVAAFARKNAILGAAVFVPGVDLPVLTLNQLRLVLRIAAAYGEDVDASRLPEIAGVVGGAFGWRAVARELLDFVPVAGWAVKGAVAYTATKAIGEAAIRYFEARRRAGPSRHITAAPADDSNVSTGRFRRTRG
jgi:uncharacterized protein (DUF697 family)